MLLYERPAPPFAHPMSTSTVPFYRAFEDRYRGSRELIKQRQAVYLPFVLPLRTSGEPPPRALDLGCGRGEWLELLGENGFDASGVDLDEGMLAACRERGLSVEMADALERLASLPDNSLSVISAFHVVEHLPFEVLQTLVAQCERVLRPGGLLIMETPNPENLVVGTNHFYLDPSHLKPIPHQLLAFLVEYHGFARNTVVRVNEAPLHSAPSGPDLWTVLSGASPDYAVVAQKTAPPIELTRFNSAFEEAYGLTLDGLAQQHEQRATQLITQVEHLQQVLRQTDEHLHHLALTVQQQAAWQSHTEDWRTHTEERLGDHAAWRQHTHARLADHDLWRSNAGMSLANAVQRLTALESRGPLQMLKHNLVKPGLRAGLRLSERLLANFPRVRMPLWSLLARLHPRLQARLAPPVAPQQAPTTTELPFGFFKRSAVPSAAELLADPRWSDLARPIELPTTTFSGSPDEPTRLEPVTTLLQMRSSRAAVAFVITLTQDEPEALARSIQSVLRQTDPSWEILMAAPEGLQHRLDAWLDTDWRIRRVTAAGAHEVNNLLLASGQCTSGYMGLLSAGDEVDDELVHRINRHLSLQPDAELIYTDEASPLAGSDISAPLHKPDWSVEHQYSAPLMGRFLAIRKTLLLNLSLPTQGNPVADEYRLALELGRLTRHIGHVDDVLYIRGRAHDQGAGLGLFHPQNLPAAQAALQAHLETVAPAATVLAHPQPGCLQVRWPLADDVPVTLVILTNLKRRDVPVHGNILLAAHFVQSIIQHSTHRGYKIIVVSDAPVPDELDQLLTKHGHSWALYPQAQGEAFSFARKSNFATALASEGVVILLNDDLEVISPNWIETLASEAMRPEVGIVGAKLLFPDGSIQHAGLAIGLNGASGHLFDHRPAGELEYAGLASITRNCSAVTGAVMAYRKAVFDELGGFDEIFRVDYNDIDLCLRCIQKGYRVVFTPWAQLYHFHNSSFNRKHDLSHERHCFVERWVDMVKRDPNCPPTLLAYCVGQGKSAQ